MLEGCGADQKVREGYVDAALLLLSINLAGKPGRLRGVGMDFDVLQELSDEQFAAEASLRCLRAVDAMYEFG